MHPDRGHRDQNEQQHEWRGPDIGQIKKHSEGDWQEETAKATDHANQTTNRSDVMWVVNRDVFVDGGFAQTHDKAENDCQGDKHANRNTEIKLDGSVDARNQIGRLRVTHDEQNDQGDDEGQIHHRTCTPFVRHPAPQCPKHRAGERIKSGKDARRG